MVMTNQTVLKIVKCKAKKISFKLFEEQKVNNGKEDKKAKVFCNAKAC